MSRYVLTVALLFMAATAQGVTHARHGADGGGNCPEAQALQAAESETAATISGKEADAPTAQTTAPTPAKRDALPRPKAGARWHSFLPGMFK